MHLRITTALLTRLLLTAAIGLVGCGHGQPKPGTVLDEAMRANRTAASFPAADEDYFHDMDGALPLLDSEVQGRNMWIVWTGGNDRFWDVLSRRQPRLARLPQDALVASDAAVLARQPLELPRTGQRAVLQESHRSRPEPLRPVARRARPGVPAGSVRGRPRSTRASRSAPAAEPCRSARTTASRRASSGCGCSRTRTSTRRRAREWDSRTLLPRPGLLRAPRPGEAVPRRHVVRVLPRRPEPGQAAGRPREPEVGEPQLERRRAVLLVGPHLRLEGPTPTARASCTSAAHVAAGHARHLARLDRQHQQPAHDERGLPPRAAHGPGEEVGQGAPGRRRARQQAVQRLRAAERSAVAVLPGAGHDLDAARAQGRLGLGRRARRAEPRLPQHRPVQRRMAAPLPRRCSAASRSRRSRSPTRRRTRSTGRRPSSRRRTWRASSSPAPTRTC